MITYKKKYRFQTGFQTIKLNPDEIFGVTQHQHIITDRSNLIVGDFFTQNNSMIKLLSLEQDVALAYWPTNPQHTIYDQFIKTGSTGLGSYSINAAYDEITISDVPPGYSWALVKNGVPLNLYLAYNNEGVDLNTIYINRLKARPNIETL